MNFYQIIFVASILGLLNIPVFMVIYDKLASEDLLVFAVVVAIVDVLVFCNDRCQPSENTTADKMLLLVLLKSIALRKDGRGYYEKNN